MLFFRILYLQVKFVFLCNKIMRNSVKNNINAMMQPCIAFCDTQNCNKRSSIVFFNHDYSDLETERCFVSKNFYLFLQQNITIYLFNTGLGKL
jgi:hypothetical protein